MGCFWSTNKERFDKTTKTLMFLRLPKTMFLPTFLKICGQRSKIFDFWLVRIH